MRIRLTMLTGFAAGYYLGTKAGRQRYDQINRTVAKVAGSNAVETATERAREVVHGGVDKARALAASRAGGTASRSLNGNGNGFGPDDASGAGPGGYSSSR